MSKVAEYTFTSDQKALLNQSMELVWERGREPVFIEVGMSGQFEAVRIGIEGHPEQPLFTLQSMPTEDGLVFAVGKFGPPPNLTVDEVATYPTFADAVQKLTAEMEAFIRKAKAPFRNLRLPALGNEDRQLLQELASMLGSTTGRQGFADFRDISEGAQACGVGVLVDGQRIVIASFVGANGSNGFECSVRNFQNEQLPGTPNVFPSVAHAIGAHRHYFTAIANSLREKQKSSWWKRLF